MKKVEPKQSGWRRKIEGAREGLQRGATHRESSNQQEVLQIKQEGARGVWGLGGLKGKMGRGVPSDCAGAGLRVPTAAA